MLEAAKKTRKAARKIARQRVAGKTGRVVAKKGVVHKRAARRGETAGRSRRRGR
jgi:hypothetical protein